MEVILRKKWKTKIYERFYLRYFFAFTFSEFFLISKVICIRWSLVGHDILLRETFLEFRSDFRLLTSIFFLTLWNSSLWCVWTNTIVLLLVCAFPSSFLQLRGLNVWCRRGNSSREPSYCVFFVLLKVTVSEYIQNYSNTNA